MEHVLPSNLQWGFKKSNFENSFQLKEFMRGFSYQGSGFGDQTLISTNTFEYGRHEFELQFDRLGFEPQCHFVIGLVKDEVNFKIFDQTNLYCCLFCDRLQCQMRKINTIERKFVMSSNGKNSSNNNNIIKVVLDFDRDIFYFTDEKNMMASMWTSIKGQRWRFQVTFKTEFAFSDPSPQHKITLLSSS